MEKTNNIPVMLKIKEIPTRFPGLTEHAVRQLLITKKLPAVLVGKKYLVCEQILADFLRQGNNQAQEEHTQGKIRRLS